MDSSRILVVDDNEITRKYMSHLLKVEGYDNLVEADCGQQVIEMFKEDSLEYKKMTVHDESSIDLVILDIMLGDMMGYEVCEEVKKNDSQIPVMCVSAIDDVENEISIVKSGADAFELKPLDARKFVLRVEKLLEKRKENLRLKSNYETLKKIHSQLPAFIRQPRENIGKYYIDDECGRGASSVVYKCHVLGGQNFYALKIMNPEVAHDVENIVTFREEIENLLNLEHPNIIKLIDHGIEEGFPYCVMEYVQGATLSDIMKEGSVSISQGVEIFTSLAGALDYIHSENVIHRDVKLENVLVDRTGKVKLTDFGLSACNDYRRSSVHGLIGTPLYIAPEIIVDGEFTPKSDNYALGVLMYYLMTGKPPYDGLTLAELVHQHCTFTPPCICTVRPDLPGYWGQLIGSLLEKNPANRPARISEFLDKERLLP